MISLSDDFDTLVTVARKSLNAGHYHNAILHADLAKAAAMNNGYDAGPTVNPIYRKAIVGMFEEAKKALKDKRPEYAREISEGAARLADEIGVPKLVMLDEKKRARPFYVVEG